MMNLDPPGISAGEPGQLGWGWIWAVTWVYGWAPSVGMVCGALHELYNCPLDGLREQAAGRSLLGSRLVPAIIAGRWRSEVWGRCDTGPLPTRECM